VKYIDKKEDSSKVQTYRFLGAHCTVVEPMFLGLHYLFRDGTQVRSSRNFNCLLSRIALTLLWESTTAIVLKDNIDLLCSASTSSMYRMIDSLFEELAI
jgi:hypothetical protein